MPWAAAAAATAAVVGGAMQANASKKAAGAQSRSADAATAAQMDMYFQSRDDLAPWRNQGQLALDQIGQLTGVQSTDPNLRKPTREDAARIAEEGHRNSFGGKGYTADSNQNLIAAAEQRAYDQLMAEYNAKVAAQPKTQQLDPMTAPLTRPFSLADFQESPNYQFNLQQGQKAIEKASAARGMFYAPQTLQDISKFSQGMASNEFMNSYNMFNQNQKSIWDRLYAMSGGGQNAAAQTGAFGTQVGGQVGNNITGGGNAQAAGIIGQGNALAGIGNNAYNSYVMQQIMSNNQPIYGSSLTRPNSGMTGANDIGMFTA
jgi:hypothetical protein